MATTQFTDEDAALLAELGISNNIAPENDITILKHVKPRVQVHTAQRAKADFVAQREVCKDFGLYKPLFEQIQGYLNTKTITPILYKSKRDLKMHGCYIVNGQKAFIAEFGERLRVIFDNGTECRLLLLSFQKAMVADKSSRVIA